MAGKATGDRRKPRVGKGAKALPPARAIKVDVIDYKDVATLRKFISERGKIRSRRISRRKSTRGSQRCSEALSPFYQK